MLIVTNSQYGAGDLDAGYSQRNARIGSIVVARRAGMYPARAVTPRMPRQAAAIVTESVGSRDSLLDSLPGADADPRHPAPIPDTKRAKRPAAAAQT